MRYLLAIDQGTSSTRAMLYSTSGQLINTSQYQITQFYPKPGWVEHDPEEIWQKTVLAIRDVASSITPAHIIACGITNQREPTLIWDKQTGQCLSQAIVWQDRRTQAICESWRLNTELIRSKTGLQLDPYFSASKLLWLLNHIPGARELVEKNRLAFGTVDSFLIWRLTGGAAHVTDITNASRTMLFNIHTHVWDEQLLQLFDIPATILPEVRACDAMFGSINDDVLGVAIPITGVAGDQHASLIGQGCFDEGMVKATFGTGGFLLLNTGSKPVHSKHHLLTTIAYQIQGKTAYGLEGSIYHAGTTVKWLRDELGLFTSSSDTETMARSLDSNDGVYLVPAFTGLGSPHWLSKPGAAIIGLSRTSHRAHFARAALESVCYQTRDILDCMHEDSCRPIGLLRVDGGMAANAWLLQFLASLCGLVVQRPYNIETTALGAAMLAAIGSGVDISLDELQKRWVCEQQFKPMSRREEDYKGWQRALHMVKDRA